MNWPHPRHTTLAVLALSACSEFGPAKGLRHHTPQTLVGAGDIATCSQNHDEATAALLDAIDGTVFTTGDNLHEHGPETDLTRCYGPSWGRHRDRTYAALGNHDYDTGTADPTFDYFGDRAGPRGRGYFSFDLGAWHIIILNSNDPYVSTAVDSPQERWLRSDLEANADARCTLAIWHHPRFYHGPWNKNLAVKPFWNALYEANADVVVNGHFHLYERYEPQTPNGEPDAERGIRQFTVGTGGRGHDALVEPAPNVEVRDNTAFGVLELTLLSDGYRWEFVSPEVSAFSDTGSSRCH